MGSVRENGMEEVELDGRGARRWDSRRRRWRARSFFRFAVSLSGVVEGEGAWGLGLLAWVDEKEEFGGFVVYDIDLVFPKFVLDKESGMRVP